MNRVHIEQSSEPDEYKATRTKHELSTRTKVPKQSSTNVIHIEQSSIEHQCEQSYHNKTNLINTTTRTKHGLDSHHPLQCDSHRLEFNRAEFRTKHEVDSH
jgi:hypothetical protein